MRVCLTGANGWIGSVVARDLLDAGRAVTGLVRSQEADALAPIEARPTRPQGPQGRQVRRHPGPHVCVRQPRLGGHGGLHADDVAPAERCTTGRTMPKPSAPPGKPARHSVDLAAKVAPKRIGCRGTSPVQRCFLRPTHAAEALQAS